MARSRTLHPTFHTNHELFLTESSSGLPLRVAYSGLWCHADREGRFEWNPMRLKLGILPFDGCDFAAVLDALAEAQFIVRYTVDGKDYGHIPTFADHQHPHPREAASKIPAPPRLAKGNPRRAKGQPRTRRGTAKSVGLSSLRTLKPSDSQDLRTQVTDDSFGEAWALYPRRPNNSRAAALRAWEARVEAGEDPAAMLDGTRRYAAYIAATSTKPQFVKLGSTFYGPDQHYRNDFTVEDPNRKIQVYVNDDGVTFTPEFLRAMREQEAAR